MRVVALFVPADCAPEIDRRKLGAGKYLQRNDLGAGVDLLVGGSGLTGAERPKLRARLGERGLRPQRSRGQREHDGQTAHKSPPCGTNLRVRRGGRGRGSSDPKHESGYFLWRVRTSMKPPAICTSNRDRKLMPRRPSIPGP